jgi:hypothetical protein
VFFVNFKILIVIGKIIKLEKIKKKKNPVLAKNKTWLINQSGNILGVK